MANGQFVSDYVSNGTGVPSGAPSVALGTESALYVDRNTGILYSYNPTSGLWTPVSGNAGGGLTTAFSQLSADVTLTNANQYYNGPSISCAAGTWFVFGSTMWRNSNSGGADFSLKLYSGSTNYASAEQQEVGAFNPSASIAAIITPTGTVTVYLASACNAAGQIMRKAIDDNAAGNTATTILGIKLA